MNPTIKNQRSTIRNLQSAIKLPTALAAVVAAGVLHLHGQDTVITENTTWPPVPALNQDSVLLISHGSNNPTLILTDGASASWEGAPGWAVSTASRATW